jgi:hypothetical protein
MSGCWLWECRINSDGYGKLKFREHEQFAHRVSWMLHRGEIPLGACILHKCDTPACVNPDHLYVGSKADNIRDREQRKRIDHSYHSGENHKDTKLTSADILRIRADPRPHRQVAKDYGIHPSATWKIKTRKSWKHVP